MNWIAPQLTEWMNGALVRRLDGCEHLPESISLDGSVRIIGFDSQDCLQVLECTTVCPLKDYLERKWILFAVDQRLRQLHFALRRLIDCTVPSLHQTYMLGANALVQVRMADAFSVLELMKKARYPQQLSLADIYLLLQPEFEQMWRRMLIEHRGRTIWTEDDCFRALETVSADIFPDARNHFASYGLTVCSCFNIQGVSSPLYIVEG